MTKAESGPKAKVEVRTIRSNRPDEIATITVAGKKVEIFETDKNPELRALKNKHGIIVEASWKSGFTYGIDSSGNLTNSPHNLKPGDKMNLRARSRAGILIGIPDSTRITHLKPEKK